MGGRYIYDPVSLEIRQQRLTTGNVIKWCGKVLLLMAIGAGVMYIVLLKTNLFLNPREQKLKQTLELLKSNYWVLLREMDSVYSRLRIIEERDDSIYRALFGIEPIDRSKYEEGIGGALFGSSTMFMNERQLIHEATNKLHLLKMRLTVEQNSLNHIYMLTQQKKNLMEHIPAIMPLNDRNVERLASGFGYRIDPIYGVVKFHEGVDFTAPEGTPVYATGAGVVEKVEYSRRGYGYHIIINHGFGYKTLYAHLSEILVKEGERVERGTLIGKVGSTGKSVAPHLHYEVWVNGNKENPIYFFWSDLTPRQYDELVRRANHNRQSLD